MMMDDACCFFVRLWIMGYGLWGYGVIGVWGLDDTFGGGI